MGLTEFLATYITAFIEKVGYASVTFFMTLESMIIPVPSEAVMPFAGFLVQQGSFTFLGVAVTSTLGSLIGSGLSFLAGWFGGRPFVRKFGKFLLLNEHHLESTEKFFQKRGDFAVLIARFIPVVRHFSSLAAGLGRTNPVRFFIFTFLGAAAWNSILCGAGMLLKSNWEEIMKFSSVIDVVIVVIIVGLIGLFIFRQVKALRQRRRKPAE